MRQRNGESERTMYLGDVLRLGAYLYELTINPLALRYSDDKLNCIRDLSILSSNAPDLILN